MSSQRVTHLYDRCSSRSSSSSRRRRRHRHSSSGSSAQANIASEYLWVSPLTMGITAGRPRRRTRAVGFPTTHRGEHCGYVPKSLEFHFEGWGGHHFTHVRGDPSYHFLTREGSLVITPGRTTTCPDFTSDNHPFSPPPPP